MNHQTHHSSVGFTLVEVMIVVAIIGVLAAIAYPSYQSYVIRTKRADMMSELQNIATQIQSQKLAVGSYKNIPLSNVVSGTWNSSTGKTQFPTGNNPLYDVTITPMNTAKTNLNGSNWTLTATPITGKQMASDGNLTLNYQGIKCRGTSCGMGEEWKD